MSSTRRDHCTSIRASTIGDIDFIRAHPHLSTQRDPDSGVSRLMFAAMRHDVDMIETLLELNADPNHVDVCNFTPLSHAIYAPELKKGQKLLTITTLIDSGAHVTDEINEACELMKKYPYFY